MNFYIFHEFLLFSIQIEESIGFLQILYFQYLTDLHVLERPEQDLTVSGKCLSVCLCMLKKLWQVWLKN